MVLPRRCEALGKCRQVPLRRGGAKWDFRREAPVWVEQPRLGHQQKEQKEMGRERRGGELKAVEDIPRWR